MEPLNVRRHWSTDLVLIEDVLGAKVGLKLGSRWPPSTQHSHRLPDSPSAAIPPNDSKLTISNSIVSSSSVQIKLAISFKCKRSFISLHFYHWFQLAELRKWIQSIFKSDARDGTNFEHLQMFQWTDKFQAESRRTLGSKLVVKIIELNKKEKDASNTL